MAKDAEIKWNLKVVLSHFSYRSCLGTSKHFKTIFSESAIAKEGKMCICNTLWYGTNI